MTRPAWLILLVGLLVTAGCLGASPDETLEEQSAADIPDLPPVAEEVVRSVQVEDRWSGEPSILALDDGALLITGAGGFTRYIEDPTDAPGDAGQSYIWRSTDDGAHWQLVDLDLPHPADAFTPYRNAVPGVEGDLSQDEAGRVYFTDLSMLATNGVSASDDGGETWTATQSAAGLPGTDRPWIQGAGEDEVYVKYLQTTTGFRVARSTDGGQTFLEDVQLPGCSQADMAIDRAAGQILIPCVGGEEGNELSVVVTETGQPMAWERIDVPDAQGPASFVFNSLSVAGQGHYTYAYAERANGTVTIKALTTTDAGQSWQGPVTLSTPNSTAVFPWTAANEDGTVAVVWYETPGQGDPDQIEGTWYPMHARFQLSGNGSTAEQVTVTRLTEAPIHEGPICTSGLGCVLDGRSEDRRLLDFFEVDVDADGASHVTWTDTVADPAKPTIWYGQVDPAEAAGS